MKKFRFIVIQIIIFMVFWKIGAEIGAAESDTYLSDEIVSYCNEIGAEYNICPELLMAMIEAESSGDPNAMNGQCVGLMQIYMDYHWDRLKKISDDDMVTIAGFFSPSLNIELGADYLVELFVEYGDLPVVLAVYNGDSRALEEGYISEYAEKVMKRSEELERIHGK